MYTTSYEMLKEAQKGGYAIGAFKSTFFRFARSFIRLLTDSGVTFVIFMAAVLSI